MGASADSSVAEREPLSLIHNERTKLTTTLTNGIAVAMFSRAKKGHERMPLFGPPHP